MRVIREGGWDMSWGLPDAKLVARLDEGALEDLVGPRGQVS
jgi:hypothetical protein